MQNIETVQLKMVSARCVPRMLTDAHNKTWNSVQRTFGTE